MSSLWTGEVANSTWGEERETTGTVMAEMGIDTEKVDEVEVEREAEVGSGREDRMDLGRDEVGV